ncbi:ATP-dependent deoxyribonuclease subunit B, partial [Lactococcus lactis subsp. lactis]|nr:ATP-dependent deoxyribonuclease subunit B [Lactococcus lactis subsp. lactis]
MIRPNVEHFQKRMLRVPNNVRMLQYKMSGYEFNLKKFEQGVYDQ